MLKDNNFNVNSVVGGSTPTVIDARASINNAIPVTDPFVDVSICYDYQVQSSNFSGCFNQRIPLRIQYFSYLAALEKDAPFKLTVEANKELPEASELFSEFISETSPESEFYSNPNALTFRFNHGVKSTLLIAKSSNKMRFQGDTFDSIYLLLNEVQSLLLARDSDYMLSYTKELPLKDFIDALQERMSILKDLKKQEDLLEEKTNEIMHVMKRLLTR